MSSHLGTLRFVSAIVGSALLGAIGHSLMFAPASNLEKGAASTVVRESPLRYPLQMRLYRFELKRDELPTFNEWMTFLADQRPAVLETLEREHMYVEGIFRDRERENDVIYWLTLKGEGGATVESSPLPVDQKHIEFMERAVIKGSRSVLSVENSLIAPVVQEAIAQHQATSH